MGIINPKRTILCEFILNWMDFHSIKINGYFSMHMTGPPGYVLAGHSKFMHLLHSTTVGNCILFDGALPPDEIEILNTFHLFLMRRTSNWLGP